MSDEVAAITLPQLLTMSAGIAANDQMDSFTLDNPDIVGQTLALGLTAAPGEIGHGGMMQQADPARCSPRRHYG